MFRLPGVLLSLKVKFVKPLMMGSAKVGAPGTSTSPLMLIVPLAPWSMIQVEIPVMFTFVTVSLPLKLARSSLLFALPGVGPVRAIQSPSVSVGLLPLGPASGASTSTPSAWTVWPPNVPPVVTMSVPTVSVTVCVVIASGKMLPEGNTAPGSPIATSATEVR